jgi:hypothetical protein
MNGDDSELDPDDFMVDPRDLMRAGYSNVHLIAEAEVSFKEAAARKGMTPDEYRKYRALMYEAERVKTWAEDRLRIEKGDGA